MLVGLELLTELSLCASLCIWYGVIISLGGFGLILRALEARFGRLSLTSFHGLYEPPNLAVCFLLTGLASVGFPGTIGFISTELLVDSAVDSSPYVGVAVVVAAAALNGIAVMRAYFLLFTGARHLSTVRLETGSRERFVFLTLSALILAGGLFPQPGISSRQRSARHILRQRSGQPDPIPDVASRPGLTR